MNEIIAQARAQWAAIAKTCTTELAEAQGRLDRAHAEARRNCEEVKNATARAAAGFTKELKKGSKTYRDEMFSFGPDPDSQEAAARVPMQAPVPSPPAKRRPSTTDAEDEQGPRIFNEDSW